MKAIRVGAGALILLSMALFGILLIPHYARNYRFERSLETIAGQPAPDDLLAARVVETAASLGIPVRKEQIQVTHAADRLRIAVPYVVPVNLPMYSVDLHFNPSVSR